MNHETTQEKQQSHTSMKIVSAILCICIIVSIIVNIYQFNSNNTLKNVIATLQSNSQALETEQDTLNKEIESKQTTVSDLSLQIEDLQKKIEQLEADNKGLSDSLKDLEDGINSTHTDIILGDDEYKGDTGADALQSEYDSLSPEDQEMVDEIIAETKDEFMEKMKKEHPEWFTDDSSTTPNQGNYEDVGTPSTGELPGEFDMSGDSGVPAGTVY